ncbi:hypothetical protein D9M70_583220 [compost metagenome]
MLAAQLQGDRVEDGADLRGQPAQGEDCETGWHELLVGDQVLLLLGVGLGSGETQALLRQLVFGERIDALGEIPLRLVFSLRQGQSVFEYRPDVIEGFPPNAGDGLNAPFIKGLRADPEARRHPAFVEPVGLPSDVRVAHDNTTTNP